MRTANGKKLQANQWVLITTSVVILFCATLKCSAQGSSSPIEEKIAYHCWQSETRTEVGGKCPATRTRTFFLCPLPTQAGALHGSVHTTDSLDIHFDNLAPDDGVACSQMTTPDFASYDVIFTQAPLNTLSMVEAAHKCEIGTCKALNSSKLMGVVSFSGSDLIFKDTDGISLTLRIFEPNKK